MESDQLFSNQNLREPEARSQQISSSNSKFFISVAASVLLTAIIAGSAVYLWQRIANERAINNLEQKISSLEKQTSTINKAETLSQPASSPDLSPAPTTDPTIVWQVYRNEEHAFLLKYPSDWFIDISPDGTILFDNKPIDGSKVVEPDQVTITLDIITDPQLIEAYSRPSDLKHSLTKKVINGITFDYITISKDNPLGSYNQSLFARTTYNNKLYRLGTFTSSKDTLDLILQTFQFVD